MKTCKVIWMNYMKIDVIVWLGVILKDGRSQF